MAMDGSEAASPVAASRAARRTRSLRLRLFGLIAAIVLPAALAFSFLIFDLYRHERAARERQLFGTAKVTAAAVEADLGRGWALLDALAKSDELAAEDWPALDAEARRMSPPGMAFLVAAPGRGQLVNTRLPPGAALPKDTLPAFASRWEQLQREERRVSDVFVGRMTPRPTVALDMLVRRDGKPAYVISLLMDPQIQAHLLAQQKLPDGWITGLLDRNGVSVARSPSIPGYVGAPGTRDMVDRVLRHEEGVTVSTSRLKRKMVVAYARTASAGWTAVVAAPQAEFEDAALRSFGLALALSALVMLGGVVLALGLSRRLLGAMDALAGQAETVGQGHARPPVVTGLTEADRVSEALAHAAAERLAHERQLADLNHGLEARVAEATESLVQAQKMEAIGQLTGGLAHDFNNLLTAILGNISLLQRTTLDERQTRLAANAQAAGERGARLTQQLLAFSRRQRLTPEAVDLAGLVAETRELIATTLGGGVRLVTPAAGLSPVVMADRTQLELAILNLTINARDAMAGAGVLTLEVGERVVGEAPGQEGAPPPGRYGAIVIRDTGGGMSEAVRRRIFEPFFTTKGPGLGSGLGLPQALGVARQLGGGMLVDSRLGEGTAVTLLLPLAAGQATARPVPAIRDGADLGGLMVLLVDDDQAVRSATAEMLALLGCTVVEAADGPSALDTVRPDTGMVVADFAMPGMTGAELAERLRKVRPGLPILLITGYADPERVGAVWDGPVLGKPFDLEALSAAVKSALAHSAAPA